MAVTSINAVRTNYLLNDVQQATKKVGTLFPRFGYSDGDLDQMRTQLQNSRARVEQFANELANARQVEQTSRDRLNTAQGNYEQAYQRYTNLQQQNLA